MAKLSKGRPGSNDATAESYEAQALRAAALGVDIDAMAVSYTRRKRGKWKRDLHIGEEAYCFLCDKPTMTFTPKGDGGVMARCDKKSCQARSWDMYYAAKAEGYDLSAPRSITRKLAKLKQAEREAEDAWNGLSKRGKAVAAALARLLGDRDSLTITLKDFVATAEIPKRTVQRGIDDAVAGGLIKRWTKADAHGFGKGPVNIYAFASETVANVIRRHSVVVATRDVLLGSKVATRGRQTIEIIESGESTRISERDMPYESASPVVDSPSPVGAAEPENGHWRNGGRKTVTKPGTSGRPVVHDDKIIVPAARPALERSSDRAGLQQGIHPSDALNQASATPTSDSEALPVERILQSAASAHARPGAKPAHTRETPIHSNDLSAAEAEAWFGYPPSAIARADSADTPDTRTPKIGAPEARMPPAATPAPPTGPTAASWRDKAEITQPDNGRRRWAKS